MKKLFIALPVLLAVFLAFPYGMGILAKRAIDNRYAHLNQIMGKSLHVEIQDYTRGWFGSKAIVRVDFHSTKLPSGVAQFFTGLLQAEVKREGDLVLPVIIQLDISHGPIIFSKDAASVPKIKFGLALVESFVDLPWNEEGKRWVQEIVGNKKFFKTTSLVHYSGSFSNTMLVPEIHYTDIQKDKKINSKGVQFFSSFSRDLNDVGFNMVLGPTLVEDSAGNFLLNVSGIYFTGDIQQNGEGLWLGDTALKLKEAMINQKDKPSLGVFGLDLIQQSIVENDRLTTFLKYKAEKINFGEQHYGFSSITFKLSGLGQKEFKTITESIKYIDLYEMSDQERTFLGLQLFSPLLHMINGAALDLAFITQSAAGEIKANLAVVTTPQKNGIVDPRVLLKQTRGSFAFSIPQSILKSLLSHEAAIAISSEIATSAKERDVDPDFSQLDTLAQKVADEHLSSLEKSGWLSAVGDHYTGKWEYREGRIFSGGQLMSDVFSHLSPKRSLLKFEE